MTQTNFKYRSADQTKFTPQAEVEPFKPFDIQAASEPLLASIRQNANTELASYKATGDSNLAWMQIAHQQDEMLAKHNAEVTRVNEADDLNQWTQFSEAAESLVMQYLKISKKNQLKQGYAQNLEFKRNNPRAYKYYIDNLKALDEPKDSVAYRTFIEGFHEIVNKESGSVQLANAYIEAGGWRKHAQNEFELGDKVAAIPHMHNQLQEKKFSFSGTAPNGETYNIENQSYNEWYASPDGANGGKNTGSVRMKIHNQFMGRISADLSGKFLDYTNGNFETMMTKVQPSLDAHYKSVAFQENDNHKKNLYNNLITDRRNKTATTMKIGHGKGGRWTVSQLLGEVDLDFETFPGANETEKRKNSLREKLNHVLYLHDTDPSGSGANLIEVLGIYNAPVGHEDHRGVAKGKTKAMSELYGGLFNEIGYVDKAMSQARVRHKLKKDNIENGIKVALEAVRLHVEQNGPLSEVELQEFVKTLAERGYGTPSDLALRIRDELPTELGLSIDDWVKRIKKDKGDTAGLLNREDYLKMGAPPQALEHEDVKTFFYKDAKFAITNKERGTLQTKFGTQYGILKKNLHRTAVLGVEQDWAGKNAYNYFLGEYERLLHKSGDDADPADIRSQAITNTQEWLKNEDNWSQLEVKPDLLTQQLNLSKTHHDEFESFGGDASAGVFSGVETRIEYLKEYISNLKKRGFTGNIHDVITGDFMYVDPEDGMRKLFFDKTWENLVRTTRAGSGRRLLDWQLEAADIKTDTIKPLPYHTTDTVEPYYNLSSENQVIFDKLSNKFPGKKLIGRNFGEVPADELLTELGINQEALISALTVQSGRAIDQFDVVQWSNNLQRLHGIKKTTQITEDNVGILQRILLLHYNTDIWDVDTTDLPHTPIMIPTIFDEDTVG